MHERAQVTHDYQAQGDEDATLPQGARVLIVGEVDSDWVRIVTQRLEDRTAKIFPRNYLKKIPSLFRSSKSLLLHAQEQGYYRQAQLECYSWNNVDAYHRHDDRDIAVIANTRAMAFLGRIVRDWDEEEQDFFTVKNFVSITKEALDSLECHFRAARFVAPLHGQARLLNGDGNAD